jgi:transcriptional regulator NrdR family protein
LVNIIHTHIIKRSRGHSEPYDKRKLYASIYASCLSVRTPTGEAELTAERICKDLTPWLDGKQEVTSADIRRQAAQHFKVYNPDAAYIYKHHQVIS